MWVEIQLKFPSPLSQNTDISVLSMFYCSHVTFFGKYCCEMCRSSKAHTDLHLLICPGCYILVLHPDMSCMVMDRLMTTHRNICLTNSSNCHTPREFFRLPSKLEGRFTTLLFSDFQSQILSHAALLCEKSLWRARL